MEEVWSLFVFTHWNTLLALCVFVSCSVTYVAWTYLFSFSQWTNSLGVWTLQWQSLKVFRKKNVFVPPRIKIYTAIPYSLSSSSRNLLLFGLWCRLLTFSLNRFQVLELCPLVLFRQRVGNQCEFSISRGQSSSESAISCCKIGRPNRQIVSINRKRVNVDTLRDQVTCRSLGYKVATGTRWCCWMLLEKQKTQNGHILLSETIVKQIDFWSRWSLEAEPLLCRDEVPTLHLMGAL